MKRGFTLVELAIVLVIIALLIGGVLAGRELIDMANRNKSIKVMEELDRAVATFRLKYKAIPGDMKNFTSYYTGGGITNGDGNGIIDGWNTTFESCQFWRHLLKTELFNKYEEIPAIGSTGGVVLDPSQKVTAVPSYKLALSTYTYIPAARTKSKHGIYFWGDDPVNQHSGAWTEQGYKAEYIGRIDGKIDDGNAYTGFIVGTTPASGYSGGACASAGGIYSLTDPEAQCINLWYLSF